jgi:hypothetical protein
MGRTQTTSKEQRNDGKTLAARPQKAPQNKISVTLIWSERSREGQRKSQHAGLFLEQVKVPKTGQKVYSGL